MLLSEEVFDAHESDDWDRVRKVAPALTKEDLEKHHGVPYCCYIAYHGDCFFCAQPESLYL